MSDPSFTADQRDQIDAELEQREPPLDWLAYDPTLTPEQAAELAETINRYTPQLRPRLSDAQERARGDLALRLAEGESVPLSLFW